MSEPYNHVAVFRGGPLDGARMSVQTDMMMAVFITDSGSVLRYECGAIEDLWLEGEQEMDIREHIFTEALDAEVFDAELKLEMTAEGQ